MARKRAKKEPEREIRPSGGEGWLVLEEVGAVLSTALALFLFASFLSYRRGSVGENLGGLFGYKLADVAIQAFGLAAYLLGPFLLLLGWTLIRHGARELSPGRVLGCGWFLLTLAVALGLALPDAELPHAGGFVGGFLAHLLASSLGRVGSMLATGSCLVLSFVVATGTPLRVLGATAAELSSRALESARRALARRGGESRAQSPDAGSRSSPARKAEPARRPRSEPLILVEKAETRRRKSEPPRQQEFPFLPDQTYKPPPLDFLDPPPLTDRKVDEEALRRSSEILEAKLADFGIEGRVVAVRPGPVITTYEIEPAPGVKVSRIVTLSDDLAMALRAPGIRVLAPVPGKAVVGIEVANVRREHVALRELLDSEAFQRSESLLSVALGKDATGNPVIADLARMPHLLVAGATGTGKSVSLNAMIVSILYKASPRDVRFVLIDLKMLELSVFEEIPHLLVPVVTDPKKAVVVLKNLAEQMDERYRRMKEKGVRNIDSYNRALEREKADREGGVVELTEVVEEGGAEPAETGPKETVVHEHMPRIVVIVDELADLMMTVGRQVEEPITRLAQKARAAGIHLILATQRPSVDVITGLIKANFPARISFQVTSRVDSRTILDCIGAERLLGGGDMLYLPPGSARPQRLHGGYVSEREIHKIVDFVKRQGQPQYVLGLLESPEEESDSELAEEEYDDELYDRAVRLVLESRQASISWVQRRLRIGYNRAARLVERMEKEGIVSSAEGGRPREVLARDPDDEES
ncbi:MAG: DNA translocase FtsK [Candidatus Binatia bacterium]|nr:MAG: DNA translocase FtsK [Candidatus Binatia bacterium]